MEWHDGLEGSARSIAETDHSPLRVVAGPGTGKTFALMRRIVRLLQQGVAPARILVCTFTRTAANDLRRALEDLGVDGANEVQATTLHSFCNKILTRDDVIRTTGRVPRSLLDYEDRFMLEDLNQAEAIGIRNLEKLLEAFNAAWARKQSDIAGWAKTKQDRKFEKQLLEWLDFHAAMLVGELIPQCLSFLRSNPEAEPLKAFDHVLVDEYQDLNKAEQELISLLSTNGKVMIIGDEDQSIYSFKHAHPEGISEYSVEHPGTKDETLDECRRCPEQVIELANHLIGQNSNRADRVLVPKKGNVTGEIHIVQWNDIDAEAEGIAEFVHQRVTNKQVDAGQVLILAPRKKIGYAIRDALNKKSTLAYSFFTEETLDGDSKNLKKCGIQKAFAFLTLLAKPDDRVALRCLLGFGSSSLRAPAWARLRAYCITNQLAPWETLELLEKGEIKISFTSDLIEQFRGIQHDLNELKDLNGNDLFNKLFWTGTFEDQTERLRIEAHALGDAEPNYNCQKLYNVLLNAIVRPEAPVFVDYVRVMSLHKSKGLTADLVVVAGCVEGLMPSNVVGRELEESRRLFYVALTRTRKVLVLSNFVRILRSLALKIGIPASQNRTGISNTISSRFWKDLGPTQPKAVTGNRFLENEYARIASEKAIQDLDLAIFDK